MLQTVIDIRIRKRNQKKNLAHSTMINMDTRVLARVLTTAGG